MTDKQSPHGAVPVFSTMEGGAAPADFSGTVWHYLLIMDITTVPMFLRETMLGYLARAAHEVVGENNFNVWSNQESIAVRYRTTGPNMDVFNERAREIVRIWATNHFVRFNHYMLTPQG